MALSRSMLEEIINFVNYISYLGSSSDTRSLELFYRRQFCEVLSYYVFENSKKTKFLSEDFNHKVFYYTAFLGLLTKASHVANCEEKVALAGLKMLEHGETKSIERFQLTNPKDPNAAAHVILVNDRDINSDETKPETWGTGYVVDPWSPTQKLIAFGPNNPLTLEILIAQSPYLKKGVLPKSYYRLVGGFSRANWLDLIKWIEIADATLTPELWNTVKTQTLLVSIPDKFSGTVRMSDVEKWILPDLSLKNIKKTLAAIKEYYLALANPKETKGIDSFRIMRSTEKPEFLSSYDTSLVNRLINVADVTVGEEKNRLCNNPVTLFAKGQLNHNANLEMSIKHKLLAWPC